MSKKLTPIATTLNWISQYRGFNGGDYPKPDEIEAQLNMQLEAEREEIETGYIQSRLDANPANINTERVLEHKKQAIEYFDAKYRPHTIKESVGK